MQKSIKLISSVAFIVSLTTSTTLAFASHLSGNINQFSIQLFKSLQQKNNLVSSPYSLNNAFTLLYPGASGSTQQQIASVLHYSPNAKKVGLAFRKLNQTLNQEGNQKPNKLIIANSVWAQKGFHYNKSYKNLLAKQLGDQLFEVDFTQQEKAAQSINQWVETKTQGKIKQLVNPRSLSKQTKLILTNAVYFKGLWQQPFKQYRTTKNAKFTLANGKLAKVAMMHQTKLFPYAETESAQVLALPYKNNHFQMILVLPKPKKTLNGLINQLTQNRLHNWMESLKRQPVKVALPRFKFNTSLLLNKPLQELGMKVPFSKQADFSKISEQPLYISEVIQKAMIEVNEAGTTAAAASAISMNTMAVMQPKKNAKQFNANHPFLFFIQNKTTGVILFAGTVRDPNQ